MTYTVLLTLLACIWLVVIDATRQDVENKIAELIQTAIANDGLWANDPYNEYYRMMTLDKFTGAELMTHKFGHFPVRLSYQDPIDEKMRKMYAIFDVHTPEEEKTEEEEEEKREDVVEEEPAAKPLINIIIPPMSTVKDSVTDSWTAMETFLEALDKGKASREEYSVLALYADQRRDDYIGEGLWLSTSEKVAITDWGRGKGSSFLALRMMNWMWKQVGIDRAFILDAAMFPCVSKTSPLSSRTPFRAAERASDFGLARTYRLWQGKQDVSIYQKGGYWFAFKSKNQILSGQRAPHVASRKLDAVIKELREYTVEKFITHDFDEVIHGRNFEETLKLESKPKKDTKASINKWLSDRNYIVKTLPEDRRYQVKTPWKLGIRAGVSTTVWTPNMYRSGASYSVARWLDLGVYRRKGCMAYYELMERLHKLGAGSPFLRDLREYLSKTKYLVMDNIRRKAFDKEFYSRLYEKYGHPTPCSWKMAVCAYRHSEEAMRARCALSNDEKVLECPPRYVVETLTNGYGICWGELCPEGEVKHFAARLNYDENALLSLAMDDNEELQRELEEEAQEIEQEIDELKHEVSALRSQRGRSPHSLH